MPGQEFDVILTGEVLPGFTHDQVAAHFAKLFKISPDHARLLLNNKRRKIKTGISRDKALKYVAHIRQLGAECAALPSSAIDDAQHTGHADGEQGGGAELTMDGLRASFREHKVARKSPAIHGAAPWLTALWTASLPMFYLGLMFAFAGATLWHASVNAAWIGQTPHWLYFAWYLGMLLAGTMLVLVLVKPLAQGFELPVAHRPISLQKNPLLSVFIKEVAHRLTAPVPREVHVVMAPTIVVRPIAGMRGLVKGEFSLTIGLPLLAGCSLTQLAGMLAHELGYYADRPGITARHVILGINSWFHRCIHHRDHWDESLERWKEKFEPRLLPIVSLLQIAVWLGRFTLLQFFRLSVLANGRIARQAVFDADKCQCEVTGSEGCADVLRRILELEIGFQTIAQQLASAHDAHKLFADLLPLVVQQSDSLSREDQAYIDECLRQRSADASEVHPEDGDRIAAALRNGQTGVFHLAGPASELVRDFAGYCQQMTLLYYEAECGLKVVREALLVGAAPDRAEPAPDPQLDELDAYLAGFFHPDRVIAPIVAGAATMEEYQLRATVGQIIDELRPKMPAYQALLLKYDNLLRRMAAIYNGRVFVNNRIPFNPEQYFLSEATDDAANIAYVHIQVEMQNTEDLLRVIESQLAERMGMELSLLLRQDQPGLADEVSALLQVLYKLEQGRALLRDFFVHATTLENLVKTISSGRDISDTIIDQDIQMCLIDYQRILDLFGPVLDPYDNGLEKRSIQARLMVEAGDPEVLKTQFNRIPVCFHKTQEIARELNRGIMVRLAGYLQNMEEKSQLAHLQDGLPERKVVNQ